MIKMDHDEIWYWYERIEEFLKQNLPQKAFCEAQKLDYKKFCYMYYRIVYKSVKYPEEYAKMIPVARKYMASGVPASRYARENGIDIGTLSSMVTHLNYMDIIDERRGKKKEEPMKFIQVPSVQAIPQEPEVMKAQNHVELIISAGVKVVVAPEVGADKLIRIIELLKDL